MHPRPDFERRLQAWACLPRRAAPRFYAFQHAVVETRIVRDVTAAAQYRQHWLGKLHRQVARDDVEGGGAACGENDRRPGEESFAIAGERDVVHPPHQVGDDDFVATRVAGDLQPFIAFEAGQRHDLARRDGTRYGERLVVGPRARAASRHTKLD